MNPKNKETEKLLSDWKKLQKIIEDAPLNELQDFVAELDAEVNPDKDPDLMRDVEKLLMQAYLGHASAIEQLASIGCEIANFFKKSITLPATKDSERVKTKPIKQQPEDASKQIGSESNWIEELDCVFERLLELQEDVINEFIPIINNFFPVMFDTPIMIVPSLTKDASKEEIAIYEKACLLTELRNRLIDKRMRRESRNAVKRTASKLRYWPVCVPAIIDKRHEDIDNYLSNLELGIELDIQLSPGKGRGNKRMLENNSHGWAIDIFDELNSRRTSHLVSKTLRQQLRAEDPRAIHSWQQKAIALHKLEKGNVDLWVDAAMAYVKDCYSTDFENVPWPDNIVRRSNAKAVSLKAAAKEFFKHHFTEMAGT